MYPKTSRKSQVTKCLLPVKLVRECLGCSGTRGFHSKPRTASCHFAGSISPKRPFSGGARKKTSASMPTPHLILSPSSISLRKPHTHKLKNTTLRLEYIHVFGNACIERPLHSPQINEMLCQGISGLFQLSPHEIRQGYGSINLFSRPCRTHLSQDLQCLHPGPLI